MTHPHLVLLLFCTHFYLLIHKALSWEPTEEEPRRQDCSSYTRHFCLTVYLLLLDTHPKWAILSTNNLFFLLSACPLCWQLWFFFLRRPQQFMLSYHPHHQVGEDGNPERGGEEGDHEPAMPAWQNAVGHGVVQQHTQWPWYNPLNTGCTTIWWSHSHDM